MTVIRGFVTSGDYSPVADAGREIPVTMTPEGRLRVDSGGGGGGGTVDQGAAGSDPWLVAGPLTDAELRATPVDTAVTAVPKLATTTRQPVWASGQVLTTSTSSAKTTAITGTEVMISTTQDIWIAIGVQASVVAAKDTAGSMFLPKGGPYTFQITSGHGVAAIQDSAAGKVSVLPVA